MTPQEALAHALRRARPNQIWMFSRADDLAAAILAALPEGWLLVREDWSPVPDGIRQERERMRAVLDASKALVAFMRSPDKDEDGNPTDWSGSLDIIAAFYAAVDDLAEQESL